MGGGPNRIAGRSFHDTQQQQYEQHQQAQSQVPGSGLRQPSPGLFSYGTSVAFGAGPGQQQKFGELSGLYAVGAVATGIGAVSATAGIAIPTFAPTMAMGSLARHGTASASYGFWKGAQGFDFFRRGLGGFGSLRGIGSTAESAQMLTATHGMGATGTMQLKGSQHFLQAELASMRAANLATGVPQALGQLSGYSALAQLEAGAGAGGARFAANVAMHEAGLSASWGKRVHAAIAGGEAAFGQKVWAAARGGETLYVANEATKRALMSRGMSFGAGATRKLAGMGKFGQGLLWGARAGRSVGGALAGTAVGALPGAAVMLGTEAIFGVGSQLYQGAADASMGETVMSHMAPRTMSYSRGQARDFGFNLEGMGKGYGMGLDETIGTMGMLAQTGEFEGVKNMTEFRKKLKKALGGLKKLSEEIGSTMSEAKQMTMALKGSGVLSQNAPELTRQMTYNANLTGVGVDRLLAAGQYGVQQAVQQGTDLDSGFWRYQRGVTGMNYLMQSGGLNESQKRIVSLMGGADQAGQALENFYGNLAPMAAIAMKRGKKDSEGFYKYELDEDIYNKFMTGGYTRKEMQKMMRKSGFGAKRSAFMKDTELYTKTAEGMQQMMVEYGLKHQSKDYSASEIMALTFGSHKNHAELMINSYHAKRGADVAAAKERLIIRDQHIRNQYAKKEGPAWFSWIDKGYDSSGLPGAGRRMADSWDRYWSGGMSRDPIGDMVDEASKKLSAGMTDEIYNAGLKRFGQKADYGFGSSNYGWSGAFMEDEREKLYSEYQSEFGMSFKEMEKRGGVEGIDYVMGDAGIAGDISSMWNDTRVLNVRKIKAHEKRRRIARSGYENLGKDQREAVESFIGHKRIMEGDMAFEEGSFMWQKWGDSKFEDDEIDRLALELKQYTGVNIVDKEAREKLFGAGVTKREALGETLMGGAGGGGMDPESIRRGMGLSKATGTDFSKFRQQGVRTTIQNLIEKGWDQDLSYEDVLEGDDIRLKEVSIEVMAGYNDLKPQAQQTLRNAIRSISKDPSAKNLMRIQKKLSAAGMEDKYKLIAGNLRAFVPAEGKDFNYIDSSITDFLDTLDAGAEILAYDQVMGDPNRIIGETFEKLSQKDLLKFGFGLNEGNRLQDFQDAWSDGGSIAERKRLTGHMLRSVTDGVGDDRRQLYDLSMSVPEVYGLHSAYQTLIDPKKEGAAKDLIEALQISGQGKPAGTDGAYTKEQAIEMLSQVEVGRFQGTKDDVKRKLEGNKMPNPREFIDALNRFTDQSKAAEKRLAAEEKKGTAKKDKPKGDGTEITGGSYCFLTTAACQHRGLPDNCDELEAMRELRDVYGIANYPEEIDEYYKVAPKIIEKVLQEGMASTVWESIFVECIEPCFKLVKDKKYSEAHQVYKKKVNSLISKYVEA